MASPRDGEVISLVTLEDVTYWQRVAPDATFVVIPIAVFEQ